MHTESLLHARSDFEVGGQGQGGIQLDVGRGYRRLAIDSALTTFVENTEVIIGSDAWKFVGAWVLST